GDHLDLRPANLDANKNRLHETEGFIVKNPGSFKFSVRGNSVPPLRGLRLGQAGRYLKLKN
ncbi:MAG: hypothetical protein OSB55_14915, partial [Verrucomicrobiota bacterium]|nr:hypothetical protein [Verrucomicrobiota bacterium]